MLNRENKELVENELKKYLKNDRAKMALLKLSEFGLLEMTRKRVREESSEILY